jgi:uncharacterized membrane protein (UPF0127 family)
MVPSVERPPRRFRGLETIELLGRRVPVAGTPAARTLGLALLDRAEAGPGLLIPRCRAVHTFGMRFELALAFLDRELRVLELRRSVPPRRLARCRAAAMVLELPSPRGREPRLALGLTPLEEPPGGSRSPTREQPGSRTRNPASPCAIPGPGSTAG